ncbi:MAG TPA: amino acid adenylation domain-containing protein, partial [Thermoanaerobaculia bacterium]
TAKFDLTLALSETAGALAGGIEYAVDLFDRPTMVRLGGHLERLLASAVASPEEELERLAWLSEAERQQVVVEWSETSSQAPLERSLSDLFLAQAQKSPEAVALVCGGEEVRYGELAARSGRLAARLQALGVGPEVPVGLLAERSVEMVVGLLGILRAGGAYVPLEAGYPGERLGLILSDTAAPVVLAQESLRQRLPPTNAQVVGLERIEEEVAGAGETVGLGPDQLAYVLYTSGSTGVPKGVGVPHRAVVRLVRETGYARFNAEEVWLQIAPLSFDASTLEIWGALLNGGRLVLMPPGVASLEEIGGALRRHGVTSLWLTAGLFHQMVEERLEDLSGLRQLLAGGEALSLPHVAQALRELGSTKLINGYGPTENTTFTCCCPLSGEEDLGSTVPLGRPIAGTRVQVLGRGMEPLPVGAAGEVWVGGEGLARGYVGRPELTAERFVPDPLGEEPGQRLYRTGDLGRWRPDGRLEFLGRIDNQVKIRGFRIEPGEVEGALAQYPGIRSAVVGVRGEGAQRRLVAWLLCESPAPTVAQVRSFLSSKLPEHMVPSALVFLESLPLTPNGKVDRRALPAPEAPEEVPGEGPRTAVEEILAGIFGEVLDLDRVGREARFFDLGGHSLLATRVVSRVRQAFGVELPLRELFESPTVSGLAGVVEEALQAGPPAKASPLVPVSRDGDLPLSFAQERLWFLDQLEPGSALYNVPAALRLSGELDLGALERSFGEVVRRHEILRTTYPLWKGQARQRIAPPWLLNIPVVDLRSLDRGLGELEARHLTLAEARRPFNLARGPLLRAQILRLGHAEHVLLLTMHHIISDGWSMGVLVREVTALYAAFREGLPSPLPELAIQYAEFTQWQREWLQGELLQRQLAYWRRQLAGAPPILALPIDRPRPVRPTHRGASVRFPLSPPLIVELRKLSREAGVTSYMLLLASFGTMLYRATGQTDLLIGSAIANRNRAETEGLIGFFVNMLVLRLDFAGAPRFREFLERVRTVALEAYAHQDLPYERVIDEVRPGREAPLLQVAFGLNKAPIDDFEVPGLSIRPYELETHAARFELTVWVLERRDSMEVSWTYATDLFDAGSIRRLHGRFESLLASILARPDVRINALEISKAGTGEPVFPQMRRRDGGEARQRIERRRI